MNKAQQANLIKLLAVVTAAPRWVGALLASEGFIIPDGWLWWWIIASAFLSLAMAGVEGWAFAFIFSAWRNQRDEGANRLLVLAMLAAIVFIVVLTPFVVSQVQDTTLSVTLAPQPWAVWAWGAAVASSTIIIVAGVGYAQKESEGVSVTEYRRLQSIASERSREIDELDTQLTTAQAKATQIDALQSWVDTLRGFDVTTGKGAAAMIAFAYNGHTPTQEVLAQALGVSKSTVRLGEKAAKEAQPRLPGINGEDELERV